jgi:acyl-CoA hydrolase
MPEVATLHEAVASVRSGQRIFVHGSAASTTRSGTSKIVLMLKPGAGVVTTWANVHYVVTEFGVANLYGRNLRQRAEALIAIAHPDHRETLERGVDDRYGPRII